MTSSFDHLGRTNFLARAVRTGNQASFGELFERVMPALHVWTRIRLRQGGRTALEAQDVVQEVWLRALRSFQAFDESRSFRGWIIGIAKNVLLESSRRIRLGQAPRASEPSTANTPDVPDSVTTIGSRLAKDESLEHFMAYVDSLEPADRSLALYCGIEEYTAAQAAERLGITPDAASQRWLRLRAEMKRNGKLAGLAEELIP